MRRRALLLASSAVTASRALAQPLPVVSDTVPVRRGPGPLSSLTAGPPGKALDLSFMTPGVLDPRITFTRASTATYFDSTGTMRTAAINAPRWDYNPGTLVLQGLLLEEARTNVLLNSATLGTQSVTVTAQAYTLSFYGTGTVTLSGTSTAGPLTGTGATQRVSLTFTPTAGTLTCTVAGSVLNAQLEAGAFPTSYIPTTAAAVTRATDSCTIPPANMGFFVPPGGSWFAEFIRFNPTVPTAIRVVAKIGLTPTTAPLYVNPSQLLGQYDGTALTTVNATTANNVLKGASTWAVGAAKICLNAGAVASSAALASGYNTIASSGVFFMANTTSPAETMSGYMRHVSYWPRVLTNAEMQQVTT